MEDMCEVCPGRFIKYTTKTDVSLPVIYCIACGRQLAPVTITPKVVSYSRDTGKASLYSIVMRCPSWKKSSLFNVFKKCLRVHDSKEVNFYYKNDKIHWYPN